MSPSHILRSRAMRPTLATAARSGAIALVTLILLLASVASVAASVTPLRWHRLNVHVDPAEHERFSCLTDGEWRCIYDKLPEPRLGLSWDRTRGSFTGAESTDEWVCPEWFPNEVCESAERVISGVGTFNVPSPGDDFSVDQDLIVSDGGRLWVYWVDQFVCPWYTSFDR